MLYKIDPKPAGKTDEGATIYKDKSCGQVCYRLTQDGCITAACAFLVPVSVVKKHYYCNPPDNGDC